MIVRFLKIKDCREPFFINVRYKIIKNCSLSVQNMKLEGYFKAEENKKQKKEPALTNADVEKYVKKHCQ